MKILITSDWYAPVINGVVTSILNLRQGLEERGHEVRILTLSGNRKSYSKDGVTYIGSAPAGFIYPNARIRIVKAKQYMAELREWKPDIIHSNCEFSTFLSARSIAKKLNVPIVHTYHTVYENYTHYFCPSKKLGKSAVSTFSRIISNKTDCLIVPSAKVADLLRSYGVVKPIFVVPTGIDLSKFSPDSVVHDANAVKEKLGVPLSNKVLLYLGRLAKEKNCEELINAAAKLRDKPITLLVVGGGPIRSDLEQLVEKLELQDKVIFTGMVQPSRTKIYYSIGDLFLNASTSETQGLTYMEALASGLPLLCRRDACLKDVIEEGENGEMYDTEDELLELLERFLNSDKVLAYRENALKSAEKFSISTFAKSMEKIYESCLTPVNVSEFTSRS
ncbi:MAG: glycosyltransferase family 4 protein [Ruminococcus sp.]|nr:glycosyltransferase family 4 protein [Ruminococcus sp.]